MKKYQLSFLLWNEQLTLLLVPREGFHRLKHMGCKVAFVGGCSQPANALYFSMMDPEHEILELWAKEF